MLAFESRRATEIETLIGKFGGHATVAPALREVPLRSNTVALAFGAALVRGDFDAVVFLTGVGAKVLLATIEQSQPRGAFLAALGQTKVIVRGPKPLAVLREWDVPVWLAAAEPNTWRELLAGIDGRGDAWPKGARVALQEYGVTNPELIDGLKSRGAIVTRVPVYQWALPEDVQPLKYAVTALARGEVAVVLFTTSVQVNHLFQVAATMYLESEMKQGLLHAVVASIGPTTSEELKRRGVQVDLEASHGKMGVLVSEAAEQATTIQFMKRSAAEKASRSRY